MDRALRRAVAILAIVGLLGLACPTSAQPPPPAPQPAPPPGVPPVAPTAPEPPAPTQPAPPRTWSEAHTPHTLQDDSGLPGTITAATLPPIKRLLAKPPSRLPPLHHLPSGRITGASVPEAVLPVQYTPPQPPPGPGPIAVNGTHVPGPPAQPAPGGPFPRPGTPIAQSVPWPQPPQGMPPAPRPSRPINLEQLRRQVEMMCGQLGSDVRVYPGPDHVLHVRVRMADPATEKYLSDRILQIPEMQEPGVHLEMELPR